jgi:putative ABC transport system permease protein
MLLGSGLGWAISLLLIRLTRVPAVISWEPFALALVFALLVGTFFGVQPARRAATLHPVEALR